MKHIKNERLKLFANALDRVSTACVTVGIATPAAGAIYNLGGFRQTFQTLELAVGLVGWLSTAVILHFCARWVLGGLEP